MTSRLRWLALPLLLVASHASACDQATAINDFLTEHQPDDAGKPVIQITRKGYHQGRERTAIVFTYQINANRERFDEWFVIFDGCESGEPISVGYPGRQHIESISIGADGITLGGFRWQLGDAMCCPTKTVAFRIEEAPEGSIRLIPI